MGHTRYGRRRQELISLLQEEIVSGKYRPGAFLPSERKLSESLAVSRGTVRAALKHLQRRNLIRIHAGRGACVANTEGQPALRRFAVRSPMILGPWRSAEQIGLFIGICKATADRHAETVVSYADAESLTEETVARYATGHIQGIIHPECGDYENLIAPLEKAGVPYAIANLECDMPAVAARVDFRAVGRQAGRHLIELGHRRIGVLGGPGTFFLYRELLAGLRGALAEEEIALDPRWTLQTDSDSQAAHRTALKLLRATDRPTAIFTTRDVRAMGLFQACRELGIAIPDQLSVISYDNLTWPEAERFGLTTIEEPVEAMGEAAVDLLEEWILTGRRPADKVFEGRLIVRNSTARPAVTS